MAPAKKKVRKRGPPLGVTPKAFIDSTVFLPGCLAQVKAIAWRGFSDDEIAETFGCDKELFQNWKRAYPSFRKAIEEGRTHPDAKVVESLYKRATGYNYTDEVSTRNGTVTLKRHAIPDVGAIEFWLTNRQAEYWSKRNSIDGGGKRGGGTKPVEVEHRSDLIAEILALVEPKSDTPPERKK